MITFFVVFIVFIRGMFGWGSISCSSFPKMPSDMSAEFVSKMTKVLEEQGSVEMYCELIKIRISL